MYTIKFETKTQGTITKHIESYDLRQRATEAKVWADKPQNGRVFINGPKIATHILDAATLSYIMHLTRSDAERVEDVFTHYHTNWR